MQITLTKSDALTLTNAMEYFDEFDVNVVPEDESEWDDIHQTINKVSIGLNDIYDQLSYGTVLDVSVDDLENILSALSVYKSIVKDNIFNLDNVKLSKVDRFLAVKSADKLFAYFTDLLSELAPDSSVEILNISQNLD